MASKSERNRRVVSTQLNEDQMRKLLVIERLIGGNRGDRSEIIRHALDLKYEYEVNRLYEEETK